LELERKYDSLRRAYATLDADLEELIEKGYRKMHRYRMEEFREAEQQEKEKRRPVEKRVLEAMLTRAASLSSAPGSSDTEAAESQ
jgi:hypothetical protein